MIFTGNLNANGVQLLFSEFLVPFTQLNYPNHHRIHMDNAPTHKAGTTMEYIRLNGLNHFRRPAQSPDLMPIELVWNDLKYFICTEWIPFNLAELITGIATFWVNHVTIDYCNSKINHLNRVLIEIIDVNGKATGM